MAITVLNTDRFWGHNPAAAPTIAENALIADFVYEGGSQITRPRTVSLPYRGWNIPTLGCTTGSVSSNADKSWGYTMRPASKQYRSVSWYAARNDSSQITRWRMCIADVGVSSAFIQCEEVAAAGAWKLTVGNTTVNIPQALALTHFEMVWNGNSVSVYVDGIRVMADVALAPPVTSVLWMVTATSAALGGLVYAEADVAGDFPIGPCSVFMATAGTEGADKQWTALGTNKVTSVSSLTWAGAAGINGNTGNKQSYVMAGITGYSQVVSIQPWVVGRTSGSLAQTMKIYMKNAGVDTTLGTVNVPTALAPLAPAPLMKNPATGLAWTAVELAALEIGVEHAGDYNP